MRNFQGIVFIWRQTNKEIFKSGLVYLKIWIKNSLKWRKTLIYFLRTRPSWNSFIFLNLYHCSFESLNSFLTSDWIRVFISAAYCEICCINILCFSRVGQNSFNISMDFVECWDSFRMSITSWSQTYCPLL